MSYCWGDPVPTDRIWLSEDAHLPIKASAAHVFRNVRNEQDIWIDSVCINQGDNDEKSRKVTVMWGIYKFVVRVIAWLGGPEDNAKLEMQPILDANPSRMDSIWLPTDRRAGFPFHFDTLAWVALAKLLDRPWFRRVSVIREIVAAQCAILICGTGSSVTVVDWEDLAKVIKHLELCGCLHLVEMKDSSKPWSYPMWRGSYQESSKVETRTRWGAAKHAREFDPHSYC